MWASATVFLECRASCECFMFFFFNDTATTEIYTDRSSAASDVYKRQAGERSSEDGPAFEHRALAHQPVRKNDKKYVTGGFPSLIHISEPTRPY